MSKGNGVPHQVLDRLVKFEASISGKQSELVAKHNDLVAQIQAIQTLLSNIVGATTQELGSLRGAFEGHVQNVGQALSGIDFNVLSLAEMMREVVGQLTQIDVLFQKSHSASKQLIDNPTSTEVQKIFADTLKVTEGELESIKYNAETWYKQLVSSAFETVKVKLERQRQEDRQAEEAARKAAEETAQKASDIEEAKSVEEELKNAESGDRIITASTSGGPGSDYPDGAEIWGGQ